MKVLWIISLLLCSSLVIAQLDTIEHVSNVDVVTFEDTRIVNTQSSETEKKGFLNFIISHRFGTFNNDFIHNLFGLDNANVRLGLDYGVTDKLTIGAGRSTLEKTFDGFLKLNFLKQSSSIPLTITALQSCVYRTGTNYAIPESEDITINRLAYSTEVYISKLFKERFALQLSPTFTYRNLVETEGQPNAVFSQGLILGYKLAHKVAINLEYFYTPPSFVHENVTNPLAIGIDLGTNGHVFQLFMTNAYGMNAPNYINKTTGTWKNGDIFFGFNVSRVFRIKAFQ